ncbi:MAG TPA: phosphotransferase [Rhizomicrobium sp.]|nr:phosphotransferase [Rhizomicrobium sp.]
MNFALPRIESAPVAARKSIALVGGHSGAEVVLITDDSDTFVRKTAHTPFGNNRLLQQATKQRLFAAQGLPFPRVRHNGFDGGRAFFEMEYVPARTLGDLVRSLAPFDSAAILSAIAELIALFRTNETDALPKALFHDKISDIAQKVQPSSLLGRVAARLHTLDWSGIPASSSHGDLTFENILIAPDGRIVFIDCDEPFASSWQLDLGKLYQDAAGFWCLRSLDKPSIGAAERLTQLASLFTTIAPEIAPQRLRQFAALHLLRTVPYSRSDETVGFALRAAARILKIAP